MHWRLNSLDKRPKLAFEYWKYKVINLVIQDFPLSPGIGHIPRVRDCHSFAFSPFFTPSPSPVPLIWAPVHFPLTISSHSPHFPTPHLFSSDSLPCQQQQQQQQQKQRSNGFHWLSVTHCLAGCSLRERFVWKRVNVQKMGEEEINFFSIGLNALMLHLTEHFLAPWNSFTCSICGQFINVMPIWQGQVDVIYNLVLLLARLIATKILGYKPLEFSSNCRTRVTKFLLTWQQTTRNTRCACLFAIQGCLFSDYIRKQWRTSNWTRTHFSISSLPYVSGWDSQHTMSNSHLQRLPQTSINIFWSMSELFTVVEVCVEYSFSIKML